MPVDVWQYVLRPTIAQTLGWAVFVSTPKGRNWFYDLFTRGLDPAESDYTSLRFPSNASPYFPESEWLDAQRTLPSDVFRQEYEAEFLEDSAGVFRNIEACFMVEPPMDADKRRCVVVGCDVAKHTDFTVLIAMDAETGECVGMDRFQHLDWPIQKERILSFMARYRGRLILDATGVGDPIFDDLKRVYPNIEGFKLTQSSKTELIQRLIVAVEQQRICWPGESEPQMDADGHGLWKVLTEEMKRFEYAISPSGHITYSAPGGYHDDCVIALALANHGRWEAGNVGRMLPVGGSIRRRISFCRRRARLLMG
jgi:hypothetical protein